MSVDGARGKDDARKGCARGCSTALFHRSLDDFLAGYPIRFREKDDGTIFKVDPPATRAFDTLRVACTSAHE
jgi:hypothetical protein